MPYLAIRGVDHYYEWITATNSERSPSSTKPVMVFLHGWAGSARYWESTAQALSSDFDCLLYDLRGFGRSPLPRPIPEAVSTLGYELETYADDLATLLDELELDQVYLNAHSTGASIAVFFLNLYTHRVKQAILTCSGIFEYDEKAFNAFYKFGGYVVSFRPKWLSAIPGVSRLFMARFVRNALPNAISRSFLDDFLMADYEAAMGTVYTAVSKRAVEVMPQEFTQLTVPTLLISGQYDQIIPADMGRQAATLNPLVQHIVIPNTAHFPMLEDPATYLSCLHQFLKQEVGSRE
ncbi:MAG: alpha/beta hydrolase [Oculatellaceae cyanobacterium bins.114]|nr:alpha/beta hydrolase [Oculatellaceae cyanobacterium bins.114]